ncbi:MAG: hypothetical protein QG656_889 [Candidatus Hydrogenedentes bacterium]|nr:hypothetical protein [Candidatus Hydrogenedentota bacterium]
MPESFDMTELNVPEGSEFHQLIEACPGIALLRFAEDEYLIREDDDSQDVFLVLKGSYVVGQPADQDEQPGETLAIVTSWPASPSFVGEMAYLGDGYRTASVRSAATTYALRLQPQHLDVVLDRFPGFTRVLCRQFTARLQGTNASLQDLQERMAIDGKQFFAEAGHVLFHKGDPATCLFQLLDGSVACIREDGECEVTPESVSFGFLDPGVYFAHGHHTATAVAKNLVSVVSIPQASMFAVVRTYPDLLVSLYRESVAENLEPRE